MVINIDNSLLPYALAIGILSLAGTVFWIWMLVKCAEEDLPGRTKTVWIIIIASTHWLGATAYFLWTRLFRKLKPSTDDLIEDADD